MGNAEVTHRISIHLDVPNQELIQSLGPSHKYFQPPLLGPATHHNKNQNIAFKASSTEKPGPGIRTLIFPARIVGPWAKHLRTPEKLKSIYKYVTEAHTGPQRQHLEQAELGSKSCTGAKFSLHLRASAYQGARFVPGNKHCLLGLRCLTFLLCRTYVDVELSSKL